MKVTSLFTAQLVIIFTFVLCVSGCMGVPEGTKPVSGFDLDPYLGKWYEIARLDHSFERGLSNVTAEYALRDDGGVRVLNRGYMEEDEEWSEADGVAYFVDDETVGQLKVSFFRPFYGSYNVIALDKESYKWSMVAGSDTEFLWILSREPSLDQVIIDQLLAQAESYGVKVDDLIFVDHSRYER